MKASFLALWSLLAPSIARADDVEVGVDLVMASKVSDLAQSWLR
jgi:hypothetical protein